MAGYLVGTMVARRGGQLVLQMVVHLVLMTDKHLVAQKEWLKGWMMADWMEFRLANSMVVMTVAM